MCIIYTYLNSKYCTYFFIFQIVYTFLVILLKIIKNYFWEKDMSPFYQAFEKVYIAIDCIIFGFGEGQLKVLTIRRDFEPELGKLSLPGGFLKPEENLHEAAKHILENLTGLRNIYMEQLHAFGELSRDPADRVISVAYYALIKIDQELEELDRAHDARWFPVAEMPKLIFDHDQMVKKAFDMLKLKAKYQPIGFELLPEKFTIPQLQTLYESINQVRYDRRNFSKKIHAMQLLQKLGEKQKDTSKKGAYLYQFDRLRYDELKKKGYNFEL